jgi:MFS family permease
MFVTFATLFGLFIAAYISTTSIILVDLVGIDKLTTSFGLITMFRGTASVLGPPIAGAVYNSTQSYTASFLMAGGFFLASAVLRNKSTKIIRFNSSTVQGQIVFICRIVEPQHF